MKERYVLLLLVCLLCISNSSGLSTDLKTSYQQGETMVVEIQGNLVEGLKASQVAFLRGHVKVPFKYELVKIEEDYFLWALAPLNANGTYTLSLENVATTVNGQKTSIMHYQNFSINDTTIPYAVEPGALVTTHDFEIVATSYTDTDLTIPLNFPVVGETVLAPGKNTLKFSIASLNKAQRIDLHIGNYTLPVYVLKNETETPVKRYIRLEPSSFTRTHYKSESKITYSITLTNTGNQTYKNLVVEYNTALVSVNPTTIKELKPDASVSFNITILSTKSDIDDSISITSKESNVSLYLPLEVTFISNLSTGSNVTNGSDAYYCIELHGSICSSESSCEGVTKTSKDGACCIGACVTAQKEPSNAWIGYLIAGLVILAGVYLYYRYVQAKDHGNVFAKKVDEAEKKVNLP